MTRRSAGESPSGALRRTGAGLLIGLGVLRGAGGVWLGLNGPTTLGPDARPDAPTGLVAASLFVVSVLCLGVGVAVWQGRERAFAWAVLPLAAFVAGGALNGYLLWGQPRPAGLLGNLAYAAVVGGILWWSRRREHHRGSDDVPEA